MSEPHHYTGQPYNATATLPVMLATGQIHSNDPYDKWWQWGRYMRSDLYDSFWRIPCDSGEFSTERKVVQRGQGAALKHFLKSPVHTSHDPAQPPTRTLDDWIYEAIEKYVVKHGHHNSGYVLELVGKGDPWIGWVLQRLESSRSMSYHHHGPLVLSENPKERADELKKRASEFQLAYWCHDVHFVLRMNAFRTEPSMKEWVSQHQAKTPIARAQEHEVLEQSVPSAREEATPWFDAMGSFSPKRLYLDEEAAEFAFRKLSNWQLFKAYWSRGPCEPMLNFFNMPLEAASLHWEGFKSGNLLTRFFCDLRLEIYAERAVGAAAALEPAA